MNSVSNHKPRKLNLDASPKHLLPDESFYLLNNNTSDNPNGSNNGASRQVSTPMPANYPACELEKPAGENYAPNTYQSKLTNELYSWVFNSNGAHFLKRINGEGKCEIVYQRQAECFNISEDPKHVITQFRAHMRLEKLCSNRHGKALIWTNGNGSIGWIDTEASIATNNFSTPFFDLCRDDCAYVQMCVPEICGCIQGEFVPLPVSEAGLSNQIVNKPILIAIRHIYYDLRASEWSDFSDTFFLNADSCFSSLSGLSRCLKLRLPIGNPMVDKIEVAYSTDGGKTWALYDTIEKYKKYNSAQEKWYQRELSELVSSTYSDSDCSFDYYFCNDKQCQSIAPITRVRNPIPRNPQGILEVKDSIGFYNYEDGVCPVDKTEIEKIKINTNCDTDDCPTELATVTVRAIIHNTKKGLNGFIWKTDNESTDVYFGGLGVDISEEQKFVDKTKNFIVYIEGEGYSAEMMQKRGVRNVTTAAEAGIVLGHIGRGTSQTKGYFQEIKLKVPKGKKGFLRLTSHKSTTGDENTSTSVIGTISDISGYNMHGDITQMGFNLHKEIFFDTCSGDQDLKETFIIEDNVTPNEFGNHTSIGYNGYIRDSFGVGIEGAILVLDDGGITAITDHNGFYAFSTWDNEPDFIEIRVEKDCQFQKIENFILHNGEYGGFFSQDYEIKNNAYNTNFYTTVTVAVKDCNGLPVGGVGIALSGSKHRPTDATGTARFKVRNYFDLKREFTAIVINKNGCLNKDCNGSCSPCITALQSNGITCYTGGTLNLGEIIINRDSIFTAKGLKSGGRYPMAAVFKGDCGRVSAAYDIGYLNIPKTQEKNKLGFCELSYDATGLVAPEYATCMKILRGINVNPYELQWLVDKIERTPDGKIKLTIQSLNDYNEKYLFKTNTVYQWLKGDRIEFIRNGDSSVFTTAQYGTLNYLTISPFNDELISGKTDAPADFFNQLLIEDDGKLNDLKEGALIEIQRSMECATEPSYHEICVTIPIVNRQLVYPTGTFTTFDTFLVTRQFGAFPPMQFEHFSPSDFWGEKLDGRGVDDLGKVHFLNPYENEKRYGRNISINSPVQFNYFGDLIKKFDAPGQGDIIAMDIKDGQIILAICEHDNFLAQAADDLVRVGSDGTIRALSAEAIISDGQPKISGQYGCQYPHVGSIYFGDGWATFADVNKHKYIIHNYQYAKPVSEKQFDDGSLYSQINTYTKRRFQQMESFNRTEPDLLNHLRFSTGYDNQSGRVYWTIKSLRNNAVMNESEPYIAPNETLMYNPISDDVMGFASVTPEGYGNLNLFDGNGCSFIIFYNAVPFIHPILSDKFNEFCGISCDWMVGVVLNKGENRVKKAMAVEVQDQKRWYVREVTTEKPGYVSEIPVIKFKRHMDMWNAAFLGNSNSREGLYRNTDTPRGYYTKILFIRDNTDALKYNTIDNNKRTEYSELDNIIIKYVDVIPTGMMEGV